MAEEKDPNKFYTVRNPSTGEIREVTEAEWRRIGRSLIAQGYEPTEGLPEVRRSKPTASPRVEKESESNEDQY